jgi:hypothetical protein
MSPVGARSPGPPAGRIAEIDGPGGGTKTIDPGTRFSGGALCHGQVAGRADEVGELLVRDGVRVDPEAVYRHVAQRPLLRVVTI